MIAKKLANSLQFKIYALLAVVITVTLTSIGVIDYYTDRNTLHQQLKNDSNVALERIATSLAEPLWNLNQTQINAILKSNLKSRQTQGLQIRLIPSNKVFAVLKDSSGQIKASQRDLQMNNMRLTKMVKYRNETVGLLTYFVNLQSVNEALYRLIIKHILETLLLNFFLITATYLLISRIIIKPLTEITSAIQTIAEGEEDLTQRIDTKRFSNEISTLGSGFNRFAYKVSQMIKRIAYDAENMSTESQHIAKANKDLDIHINKQNQSLNAVGQSMIDIEESSDKVERLVYHTARRATESAKAANYGGAIVRRNIASMEDISESVHASAASLSRLAQLGESINSIVDSIENIAKQTDLLALNAAIEAARAGEKGRGFAVVADEVRKLAIRTSEATREISPAIEAINFEVQETVEAMHDGVDQVLFGVEEVSKAGEILEHIIQGAQEVNNATQGIVAAIAEQNEQTIIVSNCMYDSLNDIKVLKNGTNKAYHSASELKQRAAQLMKTISAFKIPKD